MTENCKCMKVNGTCIFPDDCICDCHEVVPVAPAPTASAREWLRSREIQTVRWNNAHPESQMSQEDQLVYLLEAYASSQSEKLAGVGQQAADEICSEPGAGKHDFKERVAAIIDRVIAGRVKP